MKYIFLLLITILIASIYSCEKYNDPDDKNNQNIDNNFYHSEWADPITKDINGFACEAYKNTLYYCGSIYIYEISESNNALTTLYQGETFFTGLHVISDLEIIAVGLSGKVYKTVDGGLNWISINPGTSENIEDCYFFDII